MISIRKRDNLYQYCFDAGRVNGKRKQITKSGFKNKNEAYIAGQRAYDEFINWVTSIEYNMLYGDYGLWYEPHFYVQETGFISISLLLFILISYHLSD